MGKQVVVIGLGRFGTAVARSLAQLRHQVLVLDIEEKAIQEIMPFVTDAVQADATDERALRELGVNRFEVGVVSVGAGEIPTSLMATVLLKRLGVPYVVSRATSELHGATLEKVGADRVIFPEQETGTRLAHSLTAPLVVDYIGVSRDYGIGKLSPPEEFVSHTLEEMGLGAVGRDGLHVLLIKRGSDLILSPDRFERIERGDLLVVSGRDEEMEKLRQS